MVHSSALAAVGTLKEKQGVFQSEPVRKGDDSSHAEIKS
jgi:hypothetical protein